MKSRGLFVLIIILLWSSLAFAGAKFETLSVDGSTAISSGLLVPTSSDAEYQRAPIAAIIGPIETDSIRVRWDGTDPTASVGHFLPVGAILYLDNTFSIKNFHAIKVTTTASVPVTVVYGSKGN